MTHYQKHILWNFMFCGMVNFLMMISLMSSVWALDTPKQKETEPTSKNIIQGSVVDESNKPIAGAMLYLSDRMSYLEAEYQTNGIPVPFYTDESGHFAIPVSKQETSFIFIYAISPDQKQCNIGRVVYEEGKPDFPPLKIILHPAGIVTGVVKDTNGKPVEGAIVAGGDRTARMFFGKTDVKGHFAFPYSRKI